MWALLLKREWENEHLDQPGSARRRAVALVYQTEREPVAAAWSGGGGGAPAPWGMCMV